MVQVNSTPQRCCSTLSLQQFSRYTPLESAYFKQNIANIIRHQSHSEACSELIRRLKQQSAADFKKKTKIVTKIVNQDGCNPMSHEGKISEQFNSSLTPQAKDFTSFNLIKHIKDSTLNLELFNI